MELGASTTDPGLLAFQFAHEGLIYSEYRIVRKANEAFARMFMMPVDRIEGLSLDAVYPSQRQSERRVAIWTPALAAGSYNDERLMMRNDGKSFWCAVSGKSLTPADPFARVVFSFSDLSCPDRSLDISPRAHEIALLLCEGYTAKEIARQLNLSFRTVEASLARIKKKLNARNIADLVSRLHAQLIRH